MTVKKKCEDCARAVRLVRRIDCDIEAMRASLVTSPRLSMMPKGGGGPTGLEVYYSRVEDLIRVRKKAVTLAELACQDVLQITQACRDEKTKKLIHMVYIDDVTLSDACGVLGMDYHCAYMKMHRELSRLDRLAQAQ